MAVHAAHVTATTSPTAVASPTAIHLNAKDRVGCSIANLSAVTVYLGGPTVTTSTGYPLAAGEKEAFDLAVGDVLYGTVGSSTATVAVITVEV